jgi:hypothetical protein
MDPMPALKLALDLMHFPSQVRPMRAAPLPRDLPLLLHIAAGDQEITLEATRLAGKSPEAVRDAASFFIEQVLLYPDADSYRALGTGPEATSGELRRNMALLLRWLHPDHDPQGERSVFAGRVTRAWNDLKTPERRATYDHALLEKSRQREQRLSRRRSKSRRSNYAPHLAASLSRAPGHRQTHQFYRHPSRSLLRRIVLLLFGRTVH